MICIKSNIIALNILTTSSRPSLVRSTTAPKHTSNILPLIFGVSPSFSRWVYCTISAIHKASISKSSLRDECGEGRRCNLPAPKWRVRLYKYDGLTPAMTRHSLWRKNDTGSINKKVLLLSESLLLGFCRKELKGFVADISVHWHRHLRQWQKKWGMVCQACTPNFCFCKYALIVCLHVGISFKPARWSRKLNPKPASKSTMHPTMDRPFSLQLASSLLWRRRTDMSVRQSPCPSVSLHVRPSVSTSLIFSCFACAVNVSTARVSLKAVCIFPACTSGKKWANANIIQISQKRLAKKSTNTTGRTKRIL